MSLFADTFVPISAANTEPLAGRLTPTGGGTWSADPSAAATRSGASGYAYLPAGTFASLSIGNGDVDVSVKGNRLAVRAQSPTGKRYELRVSSSYVSGGYYTTQTNYNVLYRVVGSGVDSRDQNACPPIGAGILRSQCGNSAFTGYLIGLSCGSHGSFYNASLSSTLGNTTCQVYQSYGYTVYTAQMWVTDSQGRDSAVGSSVNTSGMDSGLLRLRAEGPTVTAWVDGQQVAQVTDDDTISRSRNRIILGQPSGNYSYSQFVADTLNTAPNAPQTAQPLTNRVVDRTITTRLAWLFNDPDDGDAQTKYDLRVREVGATDWQSVSMETPDTFADFAPDTYAEGSRYEWQVRTYDRGGLVGPYSAVDYFRAATPPAPPVWLVPKDGGQIPTQLFDASWSASAQTAYQVRIDTDAATIYDSGRVASSERTAPLQFPDNRVDRYLSVRVEAGELWSQWSVVKVRVFYTPPAITLMVLTPSDEDGCIRVQLRVPVPIGTQPTVIRQELYRIEGDGPERMVANNLVGDALWVDWTPASGVNNRYRVIAYGDNGTSSDSGYTDVSTFTDLPVLPDSYSEFYSLTY